MNTQVTFLVGLALLAGGWYFKNGGGIDGQPTRVLPESELIATISKGGAAVELSAHLDPDAWTLFEYGAEW